MFENAVLDNGKHRPSPWSLAGIALQSMLVVLCVLVPMVHPEILSVLPRPAVLFKPVEPLLSDQEVPPSNSGAATAHTTSQKAVAKARPYLSPDSWNRSVAPIADAGIELPSVFIGTSSVNAFSGPVVGEGLVRGNGFTSVARPPGEPSKPKPPSSPIRVGGNVQEANIVHRVLPVYPSLAKQARISGVVRLEGVITRDGAIKRLRVVSGHPLLVQSALDAVGQWLYRPTLLNGEPVEVIAPIEVSFLLGR